MQKPDPLIGATCRYLADIAELADSARTLMEGMLLLGRAAARAYEIGDLTETEAADFVEDTFMPLIDAFAAAGQPETATNA